MCFLYDNAAVLSIAAVCGAFAWLYGGTIPSALLPVMPWLVAIMLEMTFFFPQRLPGETTTRARGRVAGEIVKDPLTWVSLAFFALLLVPFFNKGLCPCCDYPQIHFDGMKADPPYPGLPFCINRMEHLSVVVWFVPSLLAAIACRHALLKRGKRMLLEVLIWNGLALSVLGIVQRVAGAEGPLWLESKGPKAYFFSSFGYPNMGGDYFTTLFALAFGLWRWKSTSHDDETADQNNLKGKAAYRIFWRKHFMLVPAAFFFFSAAMTLSRAAILLSSVLAVVFFIHATIGILATKSAAGRVKALAANLVAITLVVTFSMVFFSGDGKPSPEGGETGLRDGVAQEVSTLDGRGILDRLTGRHQYHLRVAKEIWKKHFLFGCGGWGYKHLCIPEMTDAEFSQIQKVGGVNVHNDYLQFLAEHGTVGFLLLAAAVAIILYPTIRTWRRLVKAAMFLPKGVRPPRPVAVFALSPGTFAVLCAVLATLVHALADCPMRSPAVLSLMFVSLVAADGFLPVMVVDENKSTKE